MKSPIESSFIFTVCQVGAEKALKAEVLREHPGLRFAFSRPGFITFKAQEGLLGMSFELKSVFARAYGLSLAQKASGGDLGSRAQKVVETAQEFQAQAGWGPSPLALHVFERDQCVSGEEPLGFTWGLWSQEAESAIRAAAPEGLFSNHPVAAPGSVVLDVVCVEKDEWWLGAHIHGATHAPVPGGRWPIVLPEQSPSRAYLKLEEALAWSGAPVRAGDHAVEIGSAPGGASYALLKRGVNVVGIDPGEMDPRVLHFAEGSARFEHIARSVVVVRREELPNAVDWLLVDMNTGPDTALNSVERLGRRMGKNLLGVILTLKLNEWEFAQYIPQWLERINDLGFARLRAKQLSHNRREICVVGLTPKGMARLRGPIARSNVAPA